MTTDKLPTTLGPTEIAANGIRTWGADATRFAPAAFYEAPQPSELRPAEQHPISLLPEHSFIPQKYVVHLHSQRCDHCGTTHEWTAAYAFNSLLVASVMAAIGRRVSHLVPVSRLSYNVPVEVQRVKPTQVPACHECARSPLDLSHLPSPPKPEPQRVFNPQATASPTAHTKDKPTKTIDDLLF